MTSLNQYGLVGALLVAICLSTLVFYYHGKYSAASRELTNAQVITKNAFNAFNLMHDISKATHEDKRKIAEEGEVRMVYIREAIKGDECAVRVVADAATDNLRMLENSVRAGKPTKVKP
ncbi:hypothetical protein RDT67_19295 [Serratia fonticola]|uniref:DUF2570 domain-containing protein n=1 Tax=Serratia fonticola TaxID=47917 RepID=A0AAJ1YF96_SERFO|nr:hypothetical protein [Serratia fonticola]MDQ9128566.1 hypothetical protein [Serratia fonticola]